MAGPYQESGIKGRMSKGHRVTACIALIKLYSGCSHFRRLNIPLYQEDDMCTNVDDQDEAGCAPE